MINMIDAKEAFNEFVNNYDVGNSKIKLKCFHTIRVSEICNSLAKSLGLSEKEKDLAELIGLLHDIARFEQIKIYDSFDDRYTIDHGNLGVTILSDDNKIRSFIKTNKYDEIIIKAVFAHNKAFIPDDYTEEEKLYAKILRDADKIDILYMMAANEVKYNFSEEAISLQTVESILNSKFINYFDVKTTLDKLLLNLAFINDLNFPYNYEIIKKENYINTIIDSLELKENDSIEIFKEVKMFLNKELNEKSKGVI